MADPCARSTVGLAQNAEVAAKLTKQHHQRHQSTAYHKLACKSNFDKKNTHFRLLQAILCFAPANATPRPVLSPISVNT